MVENVVIIGGGPAGLAASIYNARAGLNPLVISGSPPGGQLTLTTEVENYPGFESIMGPDLIVKMRKHAEKFGVRFIDQNVVKVDFSKKPFKVFIPTPASIPKFSGTVGTPDLSSTFETNSIIIATGAKALWLGLPSETRLRGKGVSACATCDGFFFKDKAVGVVGGGDTAMEEALTLTKFAKKVYIIHRRDFFRASKIMQERVLKNEKIEIIWNAAVSEIIGEKHVEGIRIQNVGVGRDRPLSEIKLDGVFVAIGHKPDTDLFKDQVELDEKGYIVVKDHMTSVAGIFAAGDCVDHKYRQAATAVGMGVAAALESERYLENVK